MTSPPRILVTGASGFVGRALVTRLLRDGMEIQAMVRSADRAPPGSEPLVADLLGPLPAVGDLAGVDAIVHLAARAHVLHEGSGDPLAEFRRVNRDATVALARASAAAGVRRFIFVSSIGVLGERTAPGEPFTAATRPAPEAAYAVSKHEAEIALAEVAASTPLQVVVVRPPLVHGPGAPGNFGRLMALAARGWPLPLGGLKNRRTFVARANLVDLIRIALDHPRAPEQPLLVGDARSISTTELLTLLSDALGHRARLFTLPGLSRLGGLPTFGGPIRKLTDSLEVDIGETVRRIGWQPPMSVETGIAEMALAWQSLR